MVIDKVTEFNSKVKEVCKEYEGQSFYMIVFSLKQLIELYDDEFNCYVELHYKDEYGHVIHVSNVDIDFYSKHSLLEYKKVHTVLTHGRKITVYLSDWGDMNEKKK